MYGGGADLCAGDVQGCRDARARCADGGVTLLAERVQLGPGRRRGLAPRRRPRRVLERRLERQLEGRVVAVAVVLVDPRDGAVEAAELPTRPAHHHGRRVARSSGGGKSFEIHEVVAVSCAAAAQRPTEATSIEEGGLGKAGFLGGSFLEWPLRRFSAYWRAIVIIPDA